MKTLIVNGIVLTPTELVTGLSIFIEDGKILGLDRSRPAEPAEITIDARGAYVVPGLIDLHVHGAAGCDTMDATPAAIQGMGRCFARHGVTAYLPTTVSSSSKATLAAIENVRETAQPSDGAQHMGIHLEGPYLGHAYRGAQPAEYLRAADPKEYRPWLNSNVVRLITAAPEVEGVAGLLEAATGAGIEFAVGHSSASYEQACEAAEHGMRQVTHVFNGMPALHHRSPGVVGAALDDRRLRCQVIADGIHLHPAVFRLLWRSKGADGIILVTDAMRGAAMPDGDYTLGNQHIRVAAGVARGESGELAGSTLTLDEALRNAMRFAHLTLLEALPMATRTPATAMGWEAQKGVIATGADADLVFLDDQYEVRLTMVLGRVVYNSL